MKKLCAIVLVMLIILTVPSVCKANSSGKFVVVLLDQLTLKEIRLFGSDELLALFERSSTALLNVRTDTGLDTDSTYLAFGAGNRGAEYGAIPGLLGNLLHGNNCKVAAIGNSDYGLEEYRQVVTIASDDNGYLFFRDTGGDLLMSDPTFPKKERTDYQKLAAAFEKAYSTNDLILLEVGDIARIKTGLDREVISQAGANALVRGTLARFDILLRQIERTMNPTHDTLMLVAPSPDPRQAQKGYRLSWVLLTGGDFSKRSLLETGTTRRPGIATISDLAPTLLDFFSIATPGSMNGRQLHVSSVDSGGLESLLRRYRQIFRTSAWRSWYIKGFILIQIVVLSLIALTIFSKFTYKRAWWRMIGAVLLGIMAVPLLFVVLSPYAIGYFKLYFLLTLGVAFAISLVIRKLHLENLTAVIILVNLTSLIIIVDILRGSPLMAGSLLGYCPIIGARFYGIGNEYMGVLIGGTLVGWTALIDHFTWLRERKLFLTPLIFALIMLLVGFPTLGANFGGLLTAVAAFPLTYVLMFEKSKRRSILVISVILMFLVVALTILIDTNGWFGPETHIGRMVHLISDKGFSALWEIMMRKARMNLKLLRWTIWTRVLLAFIVVLALLFKRPKGVLKEIIQEYPNLALGFIGVIFGSVVTMIVNDSGVVAAATLLFFGVLSLLYLVLQKVEINRT